VPLPAGIFEEDWTENKETTIEGEDSPKVEVINHKRNIDMQAVVYIKVAQHEEEEEVPVTIETAEGEEKKKEGDEEKEVETKIVKRMVDED